MTASSDIYGRVQPVQPVNLLAQYGQAMQVKGLQDQNALAQYTMKKAEREDGEVNALNAAYAGAVGADGKIDRAKLYQSIAQGNMGSKLPGIQRTFADQDTAATTADAAKFKLANERYGLFQKTMGALKDMPNLSKQLVVEAGANLVQQGILPREMFDGAVANMPDDVGQLRQRLTQGLATQLPPEKVFELFAPKPEKFDNGGQIQVRDMNPNSPTYGQNTGGAPIVKVQSPDNIATVAASRENAAATRSVAAATKEAAKITAEGKRVQETEMKLADDYRTESKGFAETSTAMKKVFGAIETADKNPGSALAAGTAFMKILDPNSVVRESELGMALNASGWFDRATNIANTLQNGRVMTAEQKKNLKAAAQDLFEEAKAAQREVDASYKNRASAYKLDAGRIITDRGQNAARQAPAAAPGNLSPEEQKELAALRSRFAKAKP